MKNLLLVLVFSLMVLNCFAQGFGEYNPKEKMTKTEKLILTEGDYLMKASKSFSAVALTTVIGLGTIYIGSNLDDPQPVIMAGSIIAGTGLFFYLRGCSYLHLAGKKSNENAIKTELSLAPSPDGLALVFSF